MGCDRPRINSRLVLVGRYRMGLSTFIELGCLPCTILTPVLVRFHSCLLISTAVTFHYCLFPLSLYSAVFFPLSLSTAVSFHCSLSTTVSFHCCLFPLSLSTAVFFPLSPTVSFHCCDKSKFGLWVLLPYYDWFSWISAWRLLTAKESTPDTGNVYQCA